MHGLHFLAGTKRKKSSLVFFFLDRRMLLSVQTPPDISRILLSPPSFASFPLFFSTARLSFWWSPTLSARPEKWGIFDQIHHWCVAPSFPLFPLLPQSPMAHMTTQQWEHVGEIIIQMAPRHPGKVLFAAFLSLSLFPDVEVRPFSTNLESC